MPYLHHALVVTTATYLYAKITYTRGDARGKQLPNTNNAPMHRTLPRTPLPFTGDISYVQNLIRLYTCWILALNFSDIDKF